MRSLWLLTVLFCYQCNTSFDFAGGFAGGTYSNIGKSLSQLPGIKVKARITTGSRENIKLLSQNRVDIAMAQLDVWNELSLSNQLISENVKILLPIYFEEVHFVAQKKYQQLIDLKEKTVFVGQKNSGTASTAGLIFQTLEITVRYQYGKIKEGLRKLNNGNIDAMVIVAGAPIDAINQSNRENIHLLSLQKKEEEKLTSGVLTYRNSILSTKHYFWLDAPISTIAVDSILLARNDLSEKDINELVKKIFTHQRKLAKMHEKWIQLDIMATKRLLSRYKTNFHLAIKKEFAKR